MDLKNFQEFPLFSRSLENQPKLKYLTVSELNSQIKGVLEPSFTQVWVQGEVSNFRPAASGHVYFSLKDQNSCISAAAFGWKSKKKTFDLKDGLHVLCRGRVTLYSPRGTYQLVTDLIEPLGAGALQLAFEQLKEKLAAEGLFDPARKRPLPLLPSSIAVITSPSGAAIQDMLNILKRRAPHIRIIVIPALVQGDEAPSQLIQGLEIANRFKLGDLIVLARGGGSMEDLWCFNHENLARAIQRSKLPVISAVGHEIDFTISDFVSDLRAPTPSAAAEILSGNWVEAIQQIQDLSKRMMNGMLRDLSTRKVLLSHVTARLVSPKDRLREQAQKIDELALRLERAMKVRFERKKGLLEQLLGKLDALSPLRVLERGYSLVRQVDKKSIVVKSVKQVKSGQELEITFYDGQKLVKAL